MGAAALRPSTKVGALLRSRRKDLHLTLQEVSDRMKDKGEPLPVSTLVRIEQGKLDPGVRRLHLLLGLYDIPAHLVSDLVELEQMAVEEPEGKTLEELLEDGMTHWRNGEVGEGLAHLLAIRVQQPEDQESRIMKQKACIGFASQACGLGKLKLAKQLLDDLFLEPVDPSLAATLLIQSSVVWASLGSLEMGLATIRQAHTHLSRGDHETHARISHQEARLLLKQGSAAAALKVVDEAIQHYRRAGSPQGEAKASIVKVDIQEVLGVPDAAIRTARATLRHAEENNLDLVAASARYHLGRLLVITGSTDEGVAELRAAQAEAVLLEAKIIQFHTHFHLWKLHEQQGDKERARFELQSAKHFLGFIDSTTDAANELRALLAEKAKTGKRRKRLG